MIEPRTAQTPSLDTTRLKLVCFDESCITPEYLGWLNDKAHMQWSRQKLFDHSRASCLDHLRSFEGTSNHYWSIRVKETGEAVGTASAYRTEQAADIGILIAPKAKGTGYGAEAWGAIMDFLFRVVGVDTVTGGTVVGNLAMVRIFERWKMEQFSRVYSEQYLAEIVRFQLTREQWNALS